MTDAVRLGDWLSARGHTGGDQRRLLESGKVWFGGVPCGDASRLVDPARLELRPAAPRLQPGRDLVVLWRDAHLAVLVKPSGVLSVPAPRREGADALTLAHRVLGPVFPVHRMDEETSGLLMTARDEPTQLALKDLLEHHDVDRVYHAMVAGEPAWEQRTCSLPLTRDRGDGRRGVLPENARLGPEDRTATSHFRVLARWRGGALVEARLETGRTHQIRLHLAALGHPLLGDPLYAPRAIHGASPRLALHAVRLGLRHPRSGQTLAWGIPLADDLERLRRRHSGPR